MHRDLFQLCLLLDYSCHRRISRCPFGVCSKSFVLVFCRRLIHFFVDLLSFCVVELEGSIGFGCDHDHALHRDLFLFPVDVDPVQRYLASCVEVAFRKTQLFL